MCPADIRNIRNLLSHGGHNSNHTDLHCVSLQPLRLEDQKGAKNLALGKLLALLPDSYPPMVLKAKIGSRLLCLQSCSSEKEFGNELTPLFLRMRKRQAWIEISSPPTSFMPHTIVYQAKKIILAIFQISSFKKSILFYSKQIRTFISFNNISTVSSRHAIKHMSALNSPGNDLPETKLKRFLWVGRKLGGQVIDNWGELKYIEIIKWC